MISSVEIFKSQVGEGDRRRRRDSVSSPQANLHELGSSTTGLRPHQSLLMQTMVDDVVDQRAVKVA